MSSSVAKDLAAIKNAKAYRELGPINPARFEVPTVSQWVFSVGLKEWELGEDQKRKYMKKTLTFSNFREAWLFMRLVSEVADRIDHHPEWFNVYNRVEILLSTHTVNSLSCKDMVLAHAIEAAKATVETISKTDVSQSGYNTQGPIDQFADTTFTSLLTKVEKLT